MLESFKEKVQTLGSGLSRLHDLVRDGDEESKFPLEYFTYYPEIDWEFFSSAVKNRTRQSDYPLLWDLIDADNSLWLLQYLPSYAQVASLLFARFAFLRC